jgi:hypothetical protein
MGRAIPPPEPPMRPEALWSVAGRLGLEAHSIYSPSEFGPMSLRPTVISAGFVSALHRTSCSSRRLRSSRSNVGVHCLRFLKNCAKKSAALIRSLIMLQILRPLIPVDYALAVYSPDAIRHFSSSVRSKIPLRENLCGASIF